ncbi:MAG TPA: hypothetical protein VJ984_10390 [Xanthomonadales bacterium]|nr:hypothetical protein [Xanthomonadales bacterium]
MKTFKPVKLLIALAIAAQPVAAMATSQQDAIKACTDAIIADSPKLDRAGLSVSFHESINASGRRLKKGGVFYLDIRNPKNGEVVARADCHYSRSARVLSLVEVPLTSEDAKVRSDTQY